MEWRIYGSDAVPHIGPSLRHQYDAQTVSQILDSQAWVRMSE